MSVAVRTFIQARNYTRGRAASIDVLVIHTMEAPEKPSTAENVARWFAGPTAPQASAHYCIDADAIVQAVHDKDVAWHAPGANHNGIGFEHAGYARQSAHDWSDEYSRRMLERSAALVAEKCREYGIPAVWLRSSDLRAGRRGITGHAQVSDAFRRSDHHDPGGNFPVERYLGLVKAQLGDAHFEAHEHPHATKVPEPMLRRGDSGFQVKRLQRLLAQRGFDPGEIDSQFGPATAHAVEAAQKAHGLEQDGIVGPLTWHALESA